MAQAGSSTAARLRQWANETEDGLDASTEALRHATEDTPSGAMRDDVENTPVSTGRSGAQNLMARKQSDQIVETPTEARRVRAEPGRRLLGYWSSAFACLPHSLLGSGTCSFASDGTGRPGR